MQDLLRDENIRTLLLVNVLFVFKLMTAGNITSVLRVTRKVYATPEDYALNRVELAATPARPDPDVERSRRVHQNDLENVLPFMMLSVLYALTSPPHALFGWLLWGFFAARVAYTIAYLRSMQPLRSILFGIGGLITFAIGVLCLLALR